MLHCMLHAIALQQVILGLSTYRSSVAIGRSGCQTETAKNFAGTGTISIDSALMTPVSLAGLAEATAELS